MSEWPSPKEVLDWSRRPEASPFHKKIGKAYWAMAAELARYRDAAKVATETYPKGHENEGAFIVAFDEFERLEPLVELLKLLEEK